MRDVRSRQSGLMHGLDLVRADGPAQTRRQLVQVYNGGAIPTTTPRVFLTNPVVMDAADTEGASYAPTVDTGVTIPVVALGPAVPYAGDLLVAHAIGGRWVAQRGQPRGADPCYVNCSPCGIPRTDLTLVVSPGGTVTLAFDGTSTWSGTLSGTTYTLACSGGTTSFTGGGTWVLASSTCNPFELQYGSGSTTATITGPSWWPAPGVGGCISCVPCNLCGATITGGTLSYTGTAGSGGTSFTWPTSAGCLLFLGPFGISPPGDFAWIYLNYAINNIACTIYYHSLVSGVNASQTIYVTSCSGDTITLTFDNLPIHGGYAGEPSISSVTVTLNLQYPKPQVCCSPCAIPKKDLTLSWLNALSGNGSTPLTYSAPGSWSAGCFNELLASLGCVSGQTQLCLTYFVSGGCPNGQSQQCCSEGTAPQGLKLVDYTCNPLHLHYVTHDPYGSYCSELYLAGYTDFYIDE